MRWPGIHLPYRIASLVRLIVPPSAGGGAGQTVRLDGSPIHQIGAGFDHHGLIGEAGEKGEAESTRFHARASQVRSTFPSLHELFRPILHGQFAAVQPCVG
jgi:hypothetical protein